MSVTEQKSSDDREADILSNAHWNKIDMEMIHGLITSENFFSFSGSHEGFIREALSRNAFSGSVPFLIELVSANQENWPEAEIAGLEILGRLGPIIAARGNFEAILSLARDKNVFSTQYSRPITLEIE